MKEELFEVAVGDGVLVGHRGGEGPPALVLHGGPAVTDYTEELAGELGELVSTVRYTQRGTPPSSGGSPFSIETHVSDAVAVLDHFGIDRAWAVGHSWGGHLALHLAVERPERLLGVIAVAPLGAYGGEVFVEMGEGLTRPLTPEQRGRVEEVEELRRRGEATEADVRERWILVWPQFFADPATVRPVPPRVGPECSRETNASMAAHFERGTLVRGLQDVDLPMLFLAGVQDPLPLWSIERTASLVPGAVVEAIPDCGHFAWWERPGEVRRLVGDFLAARP